MYEFTTWDIARNLLLAMRWTVGLSLIAFIGGGLVAATLLVLRLTGKSFIARAVQLYVQLFQGTPLLLQLFLVYFGLAMFGLETTAMVAASLCLVLYTSAYLTEIWRGAVESVARGQWEASASLALSFTEQMRYVIVPQAVRLGIAPTVGFMVQVVKATALTSVIGFVEMTRAGQIITNATFQPFAVYGSVALMYFALCFPLSWYSRHLENRLRR
jgi:polar amino acid transport system permease protein